MPGTDASTDKSCHPVASGLCYRLALALTGGRSTRAAYLYTHTHTHTEPEQSPLHARL